MKGMFTYMTDMNIHIGTNGKIYLEEYISLTGVQSQELLGRTQFDLYQLDAVVSFENWECKEYTLGARAKGTVTGFKACVIVWYYLKKSSWLERLYYAVIQPKGDRYKKTLGITREVTET